MLRAHPLAWRRAASGGAAPPPAGIGGMFKRLLRRPSDPAPEPVKAAAVTAPTSNPRGRRAAIEEDDDPGAMELTYRPAVATYDDEGSGRAASERRAHDARSRYADLGARSRLGGSSSSSESTSQQQPSSSGGGDAKSRQPQSRMMARRSALQRMPNEELTGELFRYGRHGARASHLRPVMDEFVRRSPYLPQFAVKDAIYQAHSAGLYPQCVAVYLARAKTHQGDSAFALYDAVVDAAFEMRCPRTISQVCAAVRTKMARVGAREVPSELALYRALWRLSQLANNAVIATAGHNKQQPTETQCLDAARNVFNVLMSYDAEGVIAACEAKRRTTVPLSDRKPLPGNPLAAASHSSTSSSVSYEVYDSAGNAKTVVEGDDGAAHQLPDPEEDRLSPDAAFEHLMSRIRRATRYESNRDGGELAAAVLIHDDYCSPSKLAVAPASRFPSLFKACRTANRPDMLKDFFMQYLRILDERRFSSALIDDDDATAAGGGPDASSAQPAAGLGSMTELLARNMERIDELVVFSYATALNNCRGFEAATALARALLLDDEVSAAYRPSPSVLAVLLRAVGESRDPILGDACARHLLEGAAGGDGVVAASPHEAFLSLMGLAKCGVANYEKIIDACVTGGLVEGGTEERGYLLLQHALNTVDVVAECDRVEATLEGSSYPGGGVSERMMVLVLQCHLRAESDAFLEKFKVFSAAVGGVENALRSWVELLVQWAERRRYTLSDEERQYIVEDVFQAHGMDDVHAPAVRSADMAMRKQIAMLLHDHRFAAAAAGEDGKKAPPAPSTRAEFGRAMAAAAAGTPAATADSMEPPTATGLKADVEAADPASPKPPPAPGTGDPRVFFLEHTAMPRRCIVSTTTAGSRACAGHTVGCDPVTDVADSPLMSGLATVTAASVERCRVPGKIAARIAPGGAPDIDLRRVGLLPAAGRLFALEPAGEATGEARTVKHATAATVIAATIRSQRNGNHKAPTALDLACPLTFASSSASPQLWADVIAEDDEAFAARLDRVHRPLHKAAPWSTPAMERPMSSGEASTVAVSA